MQYNRKIKSFATSGGTFCFQDTVFLTALLGVAADQ